MKKKLVGLMVAVAFMLSAGIASAEYKDAAKAAVHQELVNFFKAEAGNRLTMYSMKTLIDNIETVFNDNVVKPVVKAPNTPEKPNK